jgi:predicted protein tyrosine phosphatase
MQPPASARTVHVCSLAELTRMAERIRPSHIVSAIGTDAMPATPPGIEPHRHLKLSFNDINAPRDGLIHPGEEHVRELIAFADRWHTEGAGAPLLVHCWAGISRSTASAYITLCTVAGAGREDELAAALRAASPTATPNPLLIRHADDILGRQGRMITAIENIGMGEMAHACRPFELGLPPAGGRRG